MDKFGVAGAFEGCKGEKGSQASCLEKLLEGLLGSSGGFGRKFPEGDPDFLEVALVWEFPYGILPKQTSKKFASEPRKLLRSPS